MSPSKPSKPTLIDLFAGAGGMSLGFRRAGFRPIFAVESDKDAAETYKANFGDHCFAGLIQDLQSFPAADVIIGGPPCQGFSPLGKSRDDESRAALNTLWEHYLRAVREVRPKVFVIENVPEFLSSGQYHTFKETMLEDEALKDYWFDERILHAVEYGVPQRRRRGFVLASRIGPIEWPAVTRGPDSPTGADFRTVREAFRGLELEPTGGNLHVGRSPTALSLLRYAVIPPEGNRFDLARERPDLLPKCWADKLTGTSDVFGRLRWGEPSVTIRTEFFKPEKGRYLHPEANRPITHREAARLQTFPDGFSFTGSKTQIARQIGNAVPPALARALAEMVMAGLRDPQAKPPTGHADPPARPRRSGAGAHRSGRRAA